MTTTTARYRAKRLAGQGDRWKRRVEAEHARQHLADLQIELARRKAKADAWAALTPAERHEQINAAMRRTTESIARALAPLKAAQANREGK